MQVIQISSKSLYKFMRIKPSLIRFRGSLIQYETEISWEGYHHYYVTYFLKVSIFEIRLQYTHGVNSL